MSKLKTPVLLYLLFVHGLLAVLVFKTDFLEKVALRLGFAEVESGFHYYEMLEYHKRVDANVPPHSVIFFGDSLIQGLHVQAAHIDAVNFGIGNDTVVGVLRRLPWYRSLQSASAIVLQVGVNDLEYRTAPELLQDYATLLAQLPEGTPIVLNGLFPVAEEFIDDDRPWNREIRNINSHLEQMCASKSACEFLNLSTILGQQDAGLLREMHIGDGIHLSAHANALWIDELRKILTSIKD